MLDGVGDAEKSAFYKNSRMFYCYNSFLTRVKVVPELI